MNFKKLILALSFIGLIAGPATAFAQDEAPPAQEAPQGLTTYQIDPVHSSLIFRIKHLDIAYIYGMFREVDGTFQFDPENPSASSFEFTVNTNSVFTNQEQRDAHLRSPDFFAAEEFPEMTFKSTSVEELSPGTYRITGDFTMRGTTEEIQIIADETGAGPGMQGEFRRGFMTNFSINRMDYGVSFMPGGLGDHVRVTFTIEAVAQ